MGLAMITSKPFATAMKHNVMQLLRILENADADTEDVRRKAR